MKEKGKYEFKGKNVCKKQNENSWEGNGLNDKIQDGGKERIKETRKEK